MEELKIFVVTHKPVLLPNDPFFSAIQAGAAIKKEFGAIRDDTGDNISIKNPAYSELTAHYWLWKNASCKSIGLLHYRRYFSGKHQRILHLGKLIASGNDLKENLTEDKLIVAEPFVFCQPTGAPQSLEQQYVQIHGFDILQARRAILDLFPVYTDAFDFTLRNNVLYAFNLMLTSKEVFDAYCSWLFPILFHTELLINSGSRDTYQARVQAFLSERLFTTWIVHNERRLDIETRPHVYFGGI